ncbi:MAG: hypothetical protein ACOC7J_06470 [Armatimonadota bacterium]
MARTNKYAADCEVCGRRVPAGEGVLEGSSGAWKVTHADGCPGHDDADDGNDADEAPITFSVGEGYGGRNLPEGTITRDPRRGEDTILYILRTESRYVREDGMSFGVGDERGYIYTHHARPATDEEAAPLLAREEEKRAAAEREQRLKEIEDQIIEEGERPEADDGLLRPEGERFGEGPNIHGGGRWFVVGEDYIWFVRNNGMDGDDWSRNNVATGGAGAIGWRVPYDEELAETIRKCSA